MDKNLNTHQGGYSPFSRGERFPGNEEKMVTVAALLSDTSLLKDFIMSIVDEAIERHLQPKPKDEKMLSIGQVCAMLDVDKSTLWHWDKEGYLKKIHIGGKPRYKESEVNEILEGRTLLKRKRKTT